MVFDSKLASMAIDAVRLKTLVDNELARLSDDRVVRHVRAHLVEPAVVMRRWDYGQGGEEYPCWTVLRQTASATDIVYCEHGFGPSLPWGLLAIGDDDGIASIGPDYAWFPTFLTAFFESMAATELPIWRVFKTERDTSTKQPVTEEAEWDATWTQVMALRESDLENRYDCDTSIEYGRE